MPIRCKIGDGWLSNKFYDGGLQTTVEGGTFLMYTHFQFPYTYLFFIAHFLQYIRHHECIFSMYSCGVEGGPLAPIPLVGTSKQWIHKFYRSAIHKSFYFDPILRQFAMQKLHKNSKGNINYARNNKEKPYPLPLRDTRHHAVSGLKKFPCGDQLSPHEVGTMGSKELFSPTARRLAWLRQ
jgi:hypothetical protein